MSVINTNVKSLVAQNALNVNGRAMSKAMQELSTGQRINSAADDAAGLAISSKMTAQIRGLDQAVRNANDSISMLQTAEGAMVEVTNMLQRMRELGIQSANDTNTAEDRSYLDLEFQQLKTEIDRVINNTQWNGMNVLDSSFTNNTTGGKFTFQVGANSNQTVSHTINVFSLGVPDGTGTSTITFTAATAATSTIAQVSTLDMAGTYAAGDVITVNLDGNMFRYTFESEMSSASAATAVSAALNSKFGDDFTVTTTASTKVMVTSDVVNSSFTLSAAATDGEWDDIASLEVSSRANANTAVTTIETAITRVNKARADLGAVINRMNYVVDNLTNVSQNTTESRSRILDTDYAKATTDLARTQIIQQAATAMLAQANQQPASVLSLLQ